MDPNLAILAENPTAKAPGWSGHHGWKPNKLQHAAAELYVAGFFRGRIAHELAHHFWPEEEITPKLMRILRRQLQQWEGVQSFRDYIYHLAVERLDLDSPMILQAVSKKAQSGRVDAAKLSLELTGRYTPAAKEEKPTNVNIVFTGEIPRPSKRPLTAAIEGEVVDEE